MARTAFLPRPSWNVYPELSLNFVDGVDLYDGGPRLRRSQVSFCRVRCETTRSRPLMQFFTSNGRPGEHGAKAGMVAGPQGLYTQTADGPYDPAAGRLPSPFSPSRTTCTWSIPSHHPIGLI